MGLDQRHQLALIVAALRQVVRDNDLGAGIDGGLWRYHNLGNTRLASNEDRSAG